MQKIVPQIGLIIVGNFLPVQVQGLPLRPENGCLKPELLK
jgi:hypothetical protein